MEYSLVIKVKYGGTLRRFNARVIENNYLDLDMAGLRAKILSLFDFAADANLMLRYVDEDGDLVTLVDDADLQDVMRQDLKFLKIDVSVSNGSGAKSNGSTSGSAAATPSGSATATPRSPPSPNPSITTEVVLPPDAFKAVPEPIRGSVEKFTTDLLSSSPVASAIIDSVIKGLPVHEAPAAPGPSSGNGVPKESSSPEARVPRSTSGDSTSNTSHQAEPENAARGVPNAGKPVPENLREAFSKLTIDLLSSNPMTAGLADYLSKAGDTARRGPTVIPLPENLHETLSKLANDLRSSGPITANLGDSLSKIGIPNLSPYFQASVAAGVGSNNGVPKESTSSAARGPHPTCVDSSSSNADQKVEAGNVTRGVAAGVTTHVGLKTLPTDPNSSQPTNVHAVPVSPAVHDGDGKKGKKCADDSSAWKGESSGTSPNYPVPNTMPVQTAATGSGAFNSCPFARAAPVDCGQGFTFGPDVPVNMVPPRQGFVFAPRVPLVPPMGKQGTHSFKRSPNHTEASGGMFHTGVRCDGCGIYPITGPRFKSKVKENYDLCTICFNEMGNESDYIRIDRPLSARLSHHAPRCISGRYGYRPRTPTVPHGITVDAISKYAKPKLDSQFILDVNVIDGTMMAPSTAFTKIWRMRNNGTQVWPQGTQLVWTGGNQFSDTYSVYLEVPEDGVPVDKELDIAVDFRAPQLPGRYVSYWRMASPSGHRFGQRVWVLIQVDASLKDSFYDSSQGLNLNIPLGVNGSKGPHVIDINAQPTEDDAFLQHLNPDVPTESVNQVADKQSMQDLENKLPVDEAEFVGPADSIPAPATSVPSSSVSYPIIDLSAIGLILPSDQQSSAVDAQPAAPLGTGGGNNPVEETMLKELEEMGFRQVDLNKEILRMNEYNLELSVDDLCGDAQPAAPLGTRGGNNPVEETMLKELEKIGFILPSDQQSSAVDAQPAAPLGTGGGNNPVEETMLKELEEMGFRQVDLNKEILRMNEYNLGQSVDDLCGVSEWDPILEELQEMGFRDNEVNKRLLKKNNGSIKRVVMDLINGED